MSLERLLSRFTLAQKMAVLTGIFVLLLGVVTWNLWTISESYRKVETFDHTVTKLGGEVR